MIIHAITRCLTTNYSLGEQLVCLAQPISASRNGAPGSVRELYPRATTDRLQPHLEVRRLLGFPVGLVIP